MNRLILLPLATLAGAIVAAGMSAPEAPPRAASLMPRVGEAVAPEVIRPVDRPGLYGVSTAAPGTRYAIVGSMLVRLDVASNVVRSVIRPVRAEER